MDPPLAELWGLLSNRSQISNGKAKRLLSRVLDLNWVSSNGETLLTMVAAYGHAIIVELLIKAKVALSHKNFKGQTALMMSSFNSHTSIVDLLIKATAELDTQDKNGMTALVISAANGHASIVDRLIKAKADLNCQISRGGSTALGVAAMTGHLKAAWCASC
jgi:ankyrin repeat protein